MTVRIEIETISVAELRAAFPGLHWERPTLPDDGVSVLDDAPDALKLADCPDEIIRALLSGLPARPGVYAWSTEAPGGSGDAHRAVLYLGLAAGRRGLAKRLGDEIGWIRNGTRRSPRWRQRWYAGHPRVMLRSNARLHYAATPADDERSAVQVARDTERILLHFARFAAGSVPPVNGSGWWSNGAVHDQARELAWAAIQASRTLLMPGGPGDIDGGPELVDPAREEHRNEKCR